MLLRKTVERVVSFKHKVERIGYSVQRTYLIVEPQCPTCGENRSKMNKSSGFNVQHISVV